MCLAKRQAADTQRALELSDVGETRVARRIMTLLIWFDPITFNSTGLLPETKSAWNPRSGSGYELYWDCPESIPPALGPGMCVRK